MHILYIHQYFATPSGCTGLRSYEFARKWADKGHQVTMLTSTAQLSPEDLADATGTLLKKVTINGIDVLALNIPYHQKMGYTRRCLAFLAFLLLSSVLVLVLRNVQIIYATSTPLTVGIPALVAKFFKHTKYVFEVRDQWPASPIEMGLLKNSVLIKILYGLERTIYKHSEALVVVSEGMAEDVQKVAGPLKAIHIIPNGADLNLFTPEIDGQAFRQKNGWNDKLVFLHAGSMGKINGLEFVLHAAERLRSHPEILFVFVGQGSSKPALEDYVNDKQLTNVLFHPPVPKHQLPQYFAAADVALTIIGKIPIIEKHASLNKFYDGLSSGRCTLLNYSGWQRELIEKNKAGYGCQLCDLDGFIEKVKHLNTQRELGVEMGKNARRLAIELFDRDVLAKKALDGLVVAQNQQ